MSTFMIEGLDRLGKDTLIKGIMNRLGFHQVIHMSKPQVLEHYRREGVMAGAKKQMLYEYQLDSFCTMMSIAMKLSKSDNFIFNRAHLGECVYAPLYRDYSGDYVFNLERSYGLDRVEGLRLILLTENFDISKHFVDDGESFDVAKRQDEQEMFVEAFNQSIIKDKRIICVTAADGSFMSPEIILDRALAAV